MNDVPGSFSEVEVVAISPETHYSPPKTPLGHASVVLVSTARRLERVELQDSIQNYGGAACFKPVRLLRWTVPAGIWLDRLSSTYLYVTVMQSKFTFNKTLFVSVRHIHAGLRFINQNAAEFRNRAGKVLVLCQGSIFGYDGLPVRRQRLPPTDWKSVVQIQFNPNFKG